MKEFRMAKGVNEYYTSLEELRKAYGLKPVVKRTKDTDKLKSQRERFLGVCKVCKQPLVKIDGVNVLCCKNPSCNGVEMTATNEDGTERKWYIPVSRVLEGNASIIAENLFD